MIASLLKPPAVSTLPEVQAKFEAEFVSGSGIAIPLYQNAVRVVPDVLPLPGGDIETPIHEGLNWRFTRFGHSARSAQFAALLLNEDGSTFQAKLTSPRHDASKNKPIKYESPVGAGARSYFPAVPTEIREAVSKRFDEEVPLSGSFWSWLEENAHLPIVWTEGGKKALSLLSQGYIAIALYGVTGGYRKQVDGSRVLIPDVARFAVPGRVHYLAFDQDEGAATRRKVTLSIYRLSALLEAAGGAVSVIEWSPKLGKGVDDVIINAGVDAFAKAYTEALRANHWRIHQRMLQQLTYPVSTRVVTEDLSTIEIPSLPESGIIALASPKGTGKTKFIKSVVEESDKVLSATHRIALGRNLCSRLELHWRGDLDKVGGQFITGDAYTLRVGFCVDSLLSIDPVKFEGCDLVLDEVVQVVRHLITSSTCSKEGKRPALLSRFQELLRSARRVICADADLDNATLHYLQGLRGSDEPVHLIKNEFQSEGYPCTFIESPDRSSITAHLLQAVRELPRGKAIFVATDSRAYSKVTASVILKELPEVRVLVINSETSGGDLEKAFMQSPDRSLEAGEYDVIICSPSMATGVSIEASGIVDAVYGVFMGVSSTDADMAQSLSRIREPVGRVVWCSRAGSNFSRVSRSPNYLEVKRDLQQKTSAVVHLVRDGLKSETAQAIGEFNWQDVHLNLYCRISAAQNLSMSHLRDVLLVRLRLEGNRVTLEEQGSDPAIKFLLQEVREEQRFQDAETLCAAEDISYSDLLLLEQKEVKTPEENLAIAKHYMKEFYCLDTLTVEDVLWDQEGRRRSELLSLEVQLYPELARERTIRALEKQATWGKGFTPWDVSTMELKRAMRSHLSFDELIEKIISGWQWCIYDLAPYATAAKNASEQVKAALNFTIDPEMSDTQIVHQLLSQLGLKMKQFRWSRFMPGHKGEKLRVYTLDFEHFDKIFSILQSRRLKRESLDETTAATGSSPSYIDSYKGCDPGLNASTEQFIEHLAELLLKAETIGADAVASLWEEVPKLLEERVTRLLSSDLIMEGNNNGDLDRQTVAT